MVKKNKWSVTHSLMFMGLNMVKKNKCSVTHSLLVMG